MYAAGLDTIWLLGDRMVTESVTGEVTVTPVVTTLERGDVATVAGEAVPLLALDVTVVRLVVEVEEELGTSSPVVVSAAPARVAEP